MSGTSGLNTGDFTSVNVAYGIGVGVNANQGTDGQVLVSGGENQPNKWETPVSATMEKLNKGTNITMEDTTGASVNFYDGSVETTINSTDTQFENYSAGDGIHFPSGDGTAGNPFVISTDNDGITLTNTGGTDSDQNAVLKVPNTLTITDSAGTSVVYDGSTAKSITINDNDTTYQGSSTIDIDTSGGLPHTISCIKVPNTLTIDGTEGSITYDGSSAKSITINDADTTYQGSTTIHISGTTDPTIFQIDCLRVPQNLTINNADGTTNTTYNGSSAETLTLDGDTTYGVVAPITKTTPSTDGGNFGLDYDTTTLEVPTTSSNTGKLVVKQVPQNLTAGTNISLSTGSTYNGSTAITISATPVDTENGT